MTEERQNAGEGGKSGQLKIFFGYAAVSYRITCNNANYRTLRNP